MRNNNSQKMALLPRKKKIQSLDQFYVIDTLLQLISIFIKPENKINMQLKINIKYVKWFI
jgi:hypothetical protein